MFDLECHSRLGTPNGDGSADSMAVVTTGDPRLELAMHRRIVCQRDQIPANV